MKTKKLVYRKPLLTTHGKLKEITTGESQIPSESDQFSSPTLIIFFN